MGNGIIIPFVKEVKSLGEILDCKLLWEPHIASIEKKVNRDYYNLGYLDIGTMLKAIIQRLSNSDIRYIYLVLRKTLTSPHLGKN